MKIKSGFRGSARPFYFAAGAPSPGKAPEAFFI